MNDEDNTALDIGIIGFGKFGKFLTQISPEHAEIFLYDRNNSHNEEFSSFKRVASCKIIILAIPLDAYDDILPKIAQTIKPDQLVVDVCSVKTKPEQLLAKYLPEHKSLLITHPLFGPQTYKKDTTSNKLIVTNFSGDRAKQVLKYCQEALGLEVAFMTADQHDKMMANIHVVTFFIARGLANLDLPTQEFITPSYEKILNLVRFNGSHSEDLFQTIQTGNPFAAEVRQKIIDSFIKLNTDLNKK